MGFPPSPVRSPLKARIMNEAKEKEMMAGNNDDTKEKSGINGTKNTPNYSEKKVNDIEKDESKEHSKVKYKSNVKAMTEAPVKNNNDDKSSQSPLSKAQRRRRRKRKANQEKQDKLAATSGLTEDNLLKFTKIEEEESDENEEDIMKELKLNEIKQLKEDLKRQKELEDEIKSNAESVKSELDKMIEEDEAGLFNETATLVAALSEKSVKLKGLTQNPDNIIPSLSQSQSLPTTATAETIAFGTMFPSANAVGNNNDVTSPRSPMEAFNSPLPPLSQNQTSDQLNYAMPAKQAQAPQPSLSPRPVSNPNASTSPQPILNNNQKQNNSLPLPQPIRPSPNNVQSQQKRTADDAWDGGWLGPENYKDVPKNQNKKKTKLKFSDVFINYIPLY